METTDILKLLPHRYPFLLVDRIVDMDGDSSATGIMHHLQVEEPPLIYFMSIDKARLRRLVRPGDIVSYHVEKIRRRGPVWRYRGEATVNGVLVARAEFSAAIVEKESHPEAHANAQSPDGRGWG
jgi:3-hydroxyacyl-[acyl-carrier-protein] dehydratase